MIIQALVKHYEDLLERGEISRPGWGTVKVSFGLNLDIEGNLLNILSLRTPLRKGKKDVLEPKNIDVPQPVKRTVGIAPNFLCDNSTYVLGIDEKGKPERSKQCFMAFRDLHLQLLREAQSDAAKSIVCFLNKWDPENVQEMQGFSEIWKELTGGANILFFYEGQSVTEDEYIRQCWQQYYDTEADGADGVCMITGKKEQIATLHPVIKGVYGAQAMGTSLISYNAPAFCSYGKEQGENAAIGKYAAAAYGAALNHLLSKREHIRSIGDTTVVCWAEGGGPEYQDAALAALFGISNESEMTEADLRAIMSAAVNGTYVEWHNTKLEFDRHFYILGVAPNAARLSVRFFWQDTFGNMLRNINMHYERLEIVKPSYDKREMLSVWSLLQETVNQNSRDKSPSSQMAADTVKAILENGQYPASLLNGVMLRIRAEHQVSRGRAAIIKAYFLRYLQGRDDNEIKEVLQVGLNEDTGNVYYNLGRLFAVLENIQEEANPAINTTIKDKYFNSAAATPAIIFPLLLNLSQKHLRKMNEGGRIRFNKKVGEIMGKIGDGFPTRMTLPQQGSFQLGYYHQLQKRYEKKELPV